MEDYYHYLNYKKNKDNDKYNSDGSNKYDVEVIFYFKNFHQNINCKICKKNYNISQDNQCDKCKQLLEFDFTKQSDVEDELRYKINNQDFQIQKHGNEKISETLITYNLDGSEIIKIDLEIDKKIYHACIYASVSYDPNAWDFGGGTTLISFNSFIFESKKERNDFFKKYYIDPKDILNHQCSKDFNFSYKIKI